MKKTISLALLTSLLLLVLPGCESSEPEVSVNMNPPWVGPIEDGVPGIGSTPSSPIESSPGDGDVEDPQDPEPTEDIDLAPRRLPDASTVNAIDTPLLYDFINGCLDRHVSIHRDTVESDFYILRNKACPEVLHCDWYVIQGGYTLPPLGSQITTVEMDTPYLASIEKLVSKFPPERRMVEGDWELLLLKTYDEKGVVGFRSDGKWGLTTQRMFAVLQVYTEGLFQTEISNGAGWPSDWLRKEPYVSLLLQNSGVNLADSWWDTWEYQRQYRLVNEGTGGDVGYVVTTFPNQFSVYSEQYTSYDGGALRLNTNEMWRTLVSEGLTLKGAPQLEYKEEGL